MVPRGAAIISISALLFHISLSSSQSTEGTRRLKRTKLKRPEEDLCSPKTVYVEWSTIKDQIRKFKLLEDSLDDEAFSQSEAQGTAIPIKWCHSEFTPCRKASARCTYGTMIKKTTVMAITVRNDSQLVSLDYMEAQNCLCKENQSVVDIFPVIVQAVVADRCLENDGQVTAPVIADVGDNALFPFSYFSPVEDDVPKTVTIHRSDGLSYPLVLNFLWRIGNSRGHNDPNDWRTRAALDVWDGKIELQLRNITYSDEGNYFCSVEFLNSSSCFSTIRLAVSGDPPETNEGTCEPQMTYLEWNTVQHQLETFPQLDPLLSKARHGPIFSLQKCRPDLSLCTDPKRSCVSSTTRMKHVFMCVPVDSEKAKAKIEIDYMEDDSCSCGLKSTHEIGVKTDVVAINFTRVERAGICHSKCRPERVYVPWPELREHLNHVTCLNLSSQVLGHPLRVKKCRQERTPCSQPDVLCDVVEEKKVKKAVKLKNLHRTIIMKIYEAKTCDCKAQEEVTYEPAHKLHAPPIITYAALKDTLTNKNVQYCKENDVS